MDTNILYCGDCVDVMQTIDSDSIDLIYADPPFYTQRDFVAFNDKFDSMDVYIDFMRARMEECHRVIKPTGSIYVHLDWHAVHYVKVVMDDIFGYKNFRNEIVWAYSGRENPKQKMFARKHDTILFYAKGNKPTFNTQFKPYRPEYIEQFFIYDDNDGKGRYRKQPNGKGGTYNQYLNQSKGHPINDVWTDIKPLSNFGSQQERLGYDTQKPESLLERIILASSNPGDIVLDPFSGCATCVSVAQKLGRRWIGIDINPEAIEMSKKRMSNRTQQLTQM